MLMKNIHLIEKILYPLEVAFKFVGYAIERLFVSYGVHGKSESQLKQEIEEYKQYLVKLVDF